MPRVSIDDASSGKSSAASTKKPARSSSSTAPPNRTKLMIVGVVTAAALAVAGYQLVPAMFGGRTAGAGGGTDVTEPVQADSSDLAPGAVEPPVVPKPRGAGKRPGG